MIIVSAIAVSTGVGALIYRSYKRKSSPEIECKLACACGKIQGTVCAKKEDSIRIYCYCNDCREYARAIAKLGGGKEEEEEEEDTTIIGKPHGDNRVVQVCKNAVTVHQGEGLIKLARKAKPSNDKNNNNKNNNNKKNSQVYMHRFYAGCCHVPLFNTVDYLGFVGVFTDFLDDNHLKFDGPVALYPEEALVDPNHREDDISVPDFLWKLVRYLPWAKAGPFDYTLEPFYWGKQQEQEQQDN